MMFFVFLNNGRCLQIDGKVKMLKKLFFPFTKYVKCGIISVGMFPDIFCERWFSDALR